MINWIVKKMKYLQEIKFSGSITITFHEGSITRKIETKAFEKVDL